MINDENKKKMTEARKEALAKGHYATAVARIKNELAQGDLFHGCNDKTQAPT